jgi:hypothetical protein
MEKIIIYIDLVEIKIKKRNNKRNDMEYFFLGKNINGNSTLYQYLLINWILKLAETGKKK